MVVCRRRRGLIYGGLPGWCVRVGFFNRTSDTITLDWPMNGPWGSGYYRSECERTGGVRVFFSFLVLRAAVSLGRESWQVLNTLRIPY